MKQAGSARLLCHRPAPRTRKPGPAAERERTAHARAVQTPRQARTFERKKGRPMGRPLNKENQRKKDAELRELTPETLIAKSDVVSPVISP